MLLSSQLSACRLGYRLFGSGYESRLGQEIILVAKAFRAALGPTKSSVEWKQASFRGANVAGA